MTEEDKPRRRRHRRVIARATNAGPQDAPDFTEPHVDLNDVTPSAEDPAQETGTDQWWRAQRPPHWG